MASKKPAAKKNQPVARVSAEVATVPDDKFASMFAADSGAGMEKADADSFAIPFLRVLQSNSPQCDEADGNYIEGARPGMFYETVSREVYNGKDGLLIVPVYFDRTFIRWGPRGGSEGGYKGAVPPEEALGRVRSGEWVEEGSKIYVPMADGKVNEKKCDYVADTRSHYVLLIHDDGTFTPALMALSSTQIKKSKALMAMLSNRKVDGPNGKITPPTFASLIRVTTIPEQNDEGSWHGVLFDNEGLVSDVDLYNAAKSLHKAISAGAVEADFSKAEGVEESEDPSKGF